MNGILDERTWAEQEFYQAHLGDLRANRRLARIAEQAARTPAGQLTAVFRDAAEREGAFRFMENPRFSAEQIAAAAHSACALRCSAYEYVFVPTDGSSLLLADSLGHKGFGGVGSWRKGGRGLQTMTAIAVSPSGIPLGVLAQSLWAREGRSPLARQDDREPHQKESQVWLDVLHDSQQSLVREAPQTAPWFQLDRGGDCGKVILHAIDLGALFTIRAAQDRQVMDAEQYRKLRLWTRMRSEPAQALYLLEVLGSSTRKERNALMALRFCPLTLKLRSEEGIVVNAPLWAVHVKEIGSAPLGESAIEWLLLTNYPVETESAARQVVFGYSQRWRIEQFHKTWKTEGCHVEDSQLQSVEAVCKWATVLASVAMRIQRIVYLSRQQPELPADTEFSRAEIDATILLRRPKGFRKGDLPSLGEVARWLADLGGYTGPSSGGPFGAKVLARGLDYIAPVVQLLSRREDVING